MAAIEILPEQFQHYEQQWNQPVEDGDLEGRQQKKIAAYWLAYCYDRGVGGVEENDERALQILEQAIQEQDHIDDSNHRDKTGKHRYLLANLMYRRRNQQRANQLRRQAVPRLEVEVQEGGDDKNFQRAAYCLGTCLFYGNGVDEDTSRGIQLLKAAAELGHEGSVQSLFGACVCMNGMFVAEVFDWYQEMAGAPHEHAWAQMALGFCHEKGHGVEKDLVKAVEWYNKAIAQGYNDATQRKQWLLNRRLSPEERNKTLGFVTRNQKIEKVEHLIEQPDNVPLGLWAHAIATFQHQQHSPWERSSPTYLALSRGGITPQLLDQSSTRKQALPSKD